ncbi:MAG: LysM peptidoglycan-binding domain-containing protein [Chloroflexota bacterium]
MKAAGICLAVCLLWLLAAEWQPALADGPIVHVVASGETLAGLSKKFNVSLATLFSLNRISRGGAIYVGQRVLIPTSAPTVAPPVAIVRLTDVPLARQRQTLTCEEAAAAMASRGRVSEAQLVRAMSRSANPFDGIRGRTNAPLYGSLADYGVYAPALQIGLRRLGVESTVLYQQVYSEFKNAIIAQLQASRPVVWWTTYHEQWQRPVFVNLPNGANVKLVRFEHTVIILGFTANGFIYYDPQDATTRHVSFVDHQRTSSYFDNMGLVIGD